MSQYGLSGMSDTTINRAHREFVRIIQCILKNDSFARDCFWSVCWKKSGGYLVLSGLGCSFESSFLRSTYWKRKCAYTTSPDREWKECEFGTLNLL